MKKTILSLLFTVSILTVAKAQPGCFVVGPAYNTGSTKITNYSFTRVTGTSADGAPVNQFSNMKDAKCKSSSAGIVMDTYSKHWRFAMDLMFPLKNSQNNFFNINLAYGGYIKKKVGILVGISGYANQKTYPTVPPDAGYIALASNDGYNKNGNYYSNAAPGSSFGANLLLTYALSKNIVFRADYGTYLSTTESKKTPYLDNYEWKRKGSRKLEFGGVWQISDYFGVFAKVALWKTAGTVIAKNVEYTSTANSAQKLTTSVNLLPEKEFKSTNFTFGIMIPLGSASSTKTVITVQ